MHRVLFFASDYKIGLSSLLTDQLESLCKTDINIVAIAGEKEQEVGLSERIKDCKYLYRINGLDEHKDFLSLSKQISQVIKEHNSTIVHVQNNWQLLLVNFCKYFLLNRKRPKIIYTLHGFRHNHPIKSIIAKLFIGTLLFVFADKIICMCSYLKKQFSFISYKIELLPLGIPDSFFIKEPLSTSYGLQIIFPAQFRKGKNQDVVIKAFAFHIKNTHDNLSHLTLPGNGVLLNKMQTLAKELNIENRVSFPGQCTKNKILEFYCKSNIGIVASNSETYGQSIVEPFILGRCVISTPVGIAPDIINNGVNGFIFKDTDELVGILDYLYEHLYKLNELGEKCYENSNQFRWLHINNQYKTILENLSN